MYRTPALSTMEFAGSEFSHLHSAEPSSNLGNTRFHESHPQYYASDWRPTNMDQFNAWNASPQGIFPLTLIGPGQNPDQHLPPHPQPRHPTHVANTNHGKRKRTTPGSVQTSSIGGYGPLSPGETTTDTSLPSPSPPPSTSRNNHSTTHNVWAFAQPLTSNDETCADQWPTSMEPYLTGKPRTPWFGCKLCSRFGCVIYLSTFGSIPLIPTWFSDKSGVK